MKKITLFIVLALAACAQATPLPTVTPLPTETAVPAPTGTLIPTATLTLTPEPTATATITPTPTPHPAVAFAEPILAFIAGRSPTYQDDFSDQASGWTIDRALKEEPIIHGSASYVAGEYVVVADPVNSEQKNRGDFNYAWGNNYQLIPPLSNYVLQIEQNWVSGTGYQALFLCYQEDCFDYRIWSDRQLDFWGESVFPEKPRQEYLSGLAIPQVKNLRQPTTFMLIKQGLEIAIYINNLPVYYLSIPEKDQRKIEVLQLRLANDSTQTPSEVHWDNLKVWVLNP